MIQSPLIILSIYNQIFNPRLPRWKNRLRKSTGPVFTSEATLEMKKVLLKNSSNNDNYRYSFSVQVVDKKKIAVWSSIVFIY